MKKRLFFAIVFAGSSLVASQTLPMVSDVKVSQPGGVGSVTVDYKLTDGPAIVTVDFLTNGVSIGHQNFSRISGDVNKVISKRDCSVRWKPVETWPVENAKLQNVTAVVTAWPTNSPPQYMVVDLRRANTVYWYPCAEAVPFGVTDERYKTDYLVCRRIPAAGCSYSMLTGTSDSRHVHTVSFTNDFYMGIYEITQKQYELISPGTHTSEFNGYEDSPVRPMTNVGFYWGLRSNEDYFWPVDGHKVSGNRYLGKLRAHTGIEFDLPTEAQWEYACRAGTGSAYNDGSEEDSQGTGNATALDELGWFNGNSTNDNVAQTHPVGLKKPNRWGLYDMHGNVWEWCLDWFNYSYLPDAIEPEGVAKSDAYNKQRILRGGAFDKSSANCTSFKRWYHSHNVDSGARNYIGFRVIAPASLKW